jgi:NADH:quinone reductase (non-electrogenic)
MQKLVIVGGGFAGVWAALSAAKMRQRHANKRTDFTITLVSRDSWLTIRPRLYESSLDGVHLSLDSIIGPAGIDRVQGEVKRIDTRARIIVIDDGSGPRTLPYDRLVLAAGSHLQPPAIPGAEHLFTVDTYDQAVALERHLQSLTTAESAFDSDGRYTAVVVGAGFTGIETATELVSRIRAVAARVGGADRVRVVVVERASTIAPDLGPGAREHVTRAFASLGIESRVGTSVSAISAGGVTLGDGEWIPTATTVWTGGLRASGLAAQVPVERDDIGRVPVDPFLRVRGIDGVYAAGDVARVMADLDHVAPMSCQYAIPMGDRAGANAAADLLGQPAAEFVAASYVTCLDLGEAGALFTQGWDRVVTLTGFWGKAMKQMINSRLIYPQHRQEPARSARAAA